jgi:hypothetical protein
MAREVEERGTGETEGERSRRKHGGKETEGKRQSGKRRKKI